MNKIDLKKLFIISLLTQTQAKEPFYELDCFIPYEPKISPPSHKRPLDVTSHSCSYPPLKKQRVLHPSQTIISLSHLHNQEIWSDPIKELLIKQKIPTNIPSMLPSVSEILAGHLITDPATINFLFVYPDPGRRFYPHTSFYTKPFQEKASFHPTSPFLMMLAGAAAPPIPFFRHIKTGEKISSPSTNAQRFFTG